MVNNRIQTISANVLSHRMEINRVSLRRATFSFLVHFPHQVGLIFFVVPKISKLFPQLCAKYTHAFKAICKQFCEKHSICISVTAA